MPDYLPTVPRLALLVALAVVGLVVGPLFDLVLWLRHRRRWEGDCDA